MLEYNGPFALSCDDTKLHPYLHPYFDKEKDAFLLLGNAGEPYIIPDPSEFKRVVQAGNIHKATKVRISIGLTERKNLQATKLCVWALQMEIPRMPPIIVAMKCILESVNAEELAEWSDEILVGLIKAGIKVFSYACDSTVVERKVETILMEKYMGTKAVFPIVHPSKGFVDVVIIVLPAMNPSTYINHQCGWNAQ